MTTKEKILEYIQKNEAVRAHDIIEKFNISRQIVHRHLKSLQQEQKISKQGKSPKVIYFSQTSAKNKNPENKTLFPFPKNTSNCIEDNFIYFLPDGTRADGINGFISWCEKTNQKDISKAAEDYVKTFIKFEKYKNAIGLIDGMLKMKQTFPEVFLDQVFYADFYSIERFGKTKLGNLVFYGKQNQDTRLIHEAETMVHDRLMELVRKEKIEAIIFIPHSIKREKQFLPTIQKRLGLSLPVIKAEKITGDISIPQKSLSKLKDRIENAESTIFLPNITQKFKNILLIDDAVGSGSTLNVVAQKIKNKKIAQKIIGFAFIGSFKGFDVLKEI